MIKKLTLFWMCFLSFASFACTNALPTNHVSFCSSFKTAATCYCTESGLPASLCQDMKMLYNRMTSIFGSLDKACKYQRNTTARECIDDWNCYLHGGLDSQGRACSSTQQACVS